MQKLLFQASFTLWIYSWWITVNLIVYLAKIEDRSVSSLFSVFPWARQVMNLGFCVICGFPAYLKSRRAASMFPLSKSVSVRRKEFWKPLNIGENLSDPVRERKLHWGAKSFLSRTRKLSQDWALVLCKGTSSALSPSSILSPRFYKT